MEKTQGQVGPKRRKLDFQPRFNFIIMFWLQIFESLPALLSYQFESSSSLWAKEKNWFPKPHSSKKIIFSVHFPRQAKISPGLILIFFPKDQNSLGSKSYFCLYLVFWHQENLWTSAHLTWPVDSTISKNGVTEVLS